MTEVAARQSSGLGEIVLATVIAGVAGYVVTWVVFRSVGAAEYSVFAVFWSATYLIVGTIAGVQQEIARGTHLRAPGGAAGRPVARDFAMFASGTVLALVLAATPLWTAAVFPEQGVLLVVPLAVGTAGYVVMAVVAGTMYGISLWRPLAVLTVLDGVLRLAIVTVVAIAAPHIPALAWAVALPFPVAVAVVWLIWRRRIVGRAQLDVGIHRLTWNVARTMAAAASMGVLVSGLPLILRLTSPDVAPTLLGVVILAATLVRAPLIVTAMSLQSYLLVRLRNTPSIGRTLTAVIAAIAAVGLLVAVVGYFLGPAAFLIVFGDDAVVGGWFVAVLVASSAVIAGMLVTGSALLAGGRHGWYTAGWLLAALATIGLLFVPTAFDARVDLALLIAPAAGLLLHAAGLVATRSQAVP